MAGIEQPPHIKALLDENMPRELQDWLRDAKTSWDVRHVADVGLSQLPDEDVAAWARANGFLIVTFDTDYTDQQRFGGAERQGVILLRVTPTTAAEAQAALERLFNESDDGDLVGAKVIVGKTNIRFR